jgi:hypothetical protein
MGKRLLIDSEDRVIVAAREPHALSYWVRTWQERSWDSQVGVSWA